MRYIYIYNVYIYIYLSLIFEKSTFTPFFLEKLLVFLF